MTEAFHSHSHNFVVDPLFFTAAKGTIHESLFKANKFSGEITQSLFIVCLCYSINFTKDMDFRGGNVLYFENLSCSFAKLQ